MRKIVIAGGSGYLGTCLSEHYSQLGDQVYILSRTARAASKNIEWLSWNGKDIGPWASSLEGADLVINLNGKSVDCRYTDTNKALIYSTRLDATTAVGKAIQNCKKPPTVWMNAASATIYRHSLDKAMDELTGEYGTGFSVDVCQKWEATFNSVTTPATRKVLLRTTIVLGRNGGALIPLKKLAQLGLGGKQGPGNQYFSWIHDKDFVGIVDFISSHAELSGAINVAAPNPVPNSFLMACLRKRVKMPFGMPLSTGLLKFGAKLIGTETELVLKSRRVVPGRLLSAGYQFHFQNIEDALNEIIS